MNWLQIRLFGPYFSSFSTNSYGYYSQKSQNLFSYGQIFASAQIVRQAASALYILKCRKIAPGFGVPARRDFSSIAVAMQLKSQRIWRDK
jgi:hypothetical protein